MKHAKCFSLSPLSRCGVNPSREGRGGREGREGGCSNRRQQLALSIRPLYGSQGFLGFHSADKSQNSAAGAVFSGFWVREKQTLN